jgi:hypothetical protein
MAKPAKDQPPLGPGECNSDTGCKLIKVTPQWFNTLKRQGVFKPISSNRYRVIEIVHGYIDYLKDENRASTKTASASRVQDARAAQIEMQTAKELRDLIPKDEVCDFLTEATGTFRAELAGVPAASSRDPEVRAEIEKNLDAAIERCRINFAAAEVNARSRRPLVMEAEEADA